MDFGLTHIRHSDVRNSFSLWIKVWKNFSVALDKTIRFPLLKAVHHHQCGLFNRILWSKLECLQVKQEKNRIFEIYTYTHSYARPLSNSHNHTHTLFRQILCCSKACQVFFWWIHPFIIKGQMEIVDHVIASTTMFVSHHSNVCIMMKPNELKTEVLLFLPFITCNASAFMEIRIEHSNFWKWILLRMGPDS